jgi:lipopolysaccharide biosynthesis regulator YciM
MSAKKTQILLLVGALILFVLLYIAPKTELPHAEGDSHEHSSEKIMASADANLVVYLNLALKTLEPVKKQQLDKWISKSNFDSSTVFWDKLKRPDLAAHFAEEGAKKISSSENWIKAGNRYYYAIQFSQDESEVAVLYQCAMRCFAKGLELNPKNTDAKIMLASCYVEGSQDPMQGISRLREIEKTDSNNVKLQLTFAFFSVKSGQLDKAITRFNKVLKVDSNYIEAYLHLADAYEKQNKTNKAIEMLKKYAEKTTEPTAKIEINKYIEQLKNK